MKYVLVTGCVAVALFLSGQLQAQPDRWTYIATRKAAEVFYDRESLYFHEHTIHADLLVNLSQRVDGAHSSVGWTVVDCRNLTVRSVTSIGYSERWAVGHVVYKGGEEQPKKIDASHYLIQMFCNLL